MPNRAEIIAQLTAEGPFELKPDLSGPYPMQGYRNAPSSLKAVLETTVQYADRPFLIYEAETLTFAEHFAKVAALSRHLLAAGVGKGDRVALGMRNYPEWSVSFWACQAIGAIVVALNAWWTASELAFAVQDSAPTALLIDGERLERLRPLLQNPDLKAVVVTRRGGAGEGGLEFGEVTDAPTTHLPRVDVAPGDIATILYTSGTTGNPKGAMATHANHVTNLMNSLLAGAVARMATGLPAQADPDAPQAGVLQTFPFFHIGGLTGLYFGAATGAKIALMYKWVPVEAVRLIETNALSSVAGVPIVVRQLLETAAGQGARMDSLVGVTSGGAPVPPDLIRRIGEQFSNRAAPGNGYGLTETTSAVITNSGADYLAQPDSVGRPVVTAQVRVVDEAGRQQPQGEIGELWVRGPNVIPGYWNNPDATEAAFGGGWFRTGDLGFVDADGLYYVVDRMKDVIIRAGENVYCAEVEAAILEHPLVRDAGVVGLPHADLGEEVAAVILVASDQMGEGVAEDITRSLAGKLARFKIPTAISLTDRELPRTATGKILKREMRSRYF
ncbi:MAG TPA: class I adenylate-forming enzyme family protein [Caulobacteraceae bacterium]|jgi:long-chain acyl-CoA synthetase